MSWTILWLCGFGVFIGNLIISGNVFKSMIAVVLYMIFVSILKIFSIFVKDACQYKIDKLNKELEQLNGRNNE